jgi:tRNA-dihydrouridine synthase
MKIGYFISDIGISGGIKIVLQHVKMLKKMNYDAILIARTITDKWDLCEEIAISKTGNLDDIPNCDVYVGTHSSDVKFLVQHVKGKIAHLCQGYAPIKYLARIKKDFIPEKYERRNVFFLFERLIHKRKYRRKIKRIESIYALPTVKAAVSKHLVELEDCINNGLMVARNFTLETTKTHLFTFIKELD